MIGPFARRRLAACLIFLLPLGALSAAPAVASPSAAAAPAKAAPAKPEGGAAKTDEMPGAKPDDGPSPTEIRDKLVGIRSRVDGWALAPEFLSEQMRAATALRTAAGECQQYADERLARVQQVLAAIGEKQTDEGAELAERRKRAVARKAREENRRAECRLSVVYADSLIARIDTAQKNLLKQRLIRRGPDAGTLALWNVEHPRILADAVLGVAGDAFGLRSAAPSVVALVLLAAGLGAFAGRWAHRRLKRRLPHRPESGTGVSTAIVRAVVDAFGRQAAFWTPAAAAAATFLALDLLDGTLAYGSIFAVAVAGFLTARILVRALLEPGAPLLRLAGMDERLASRLRRCLGALAGTTAVAVAMSYAPLRTSLPFEADRFARFLLIAALVLNLGWFTWLLGLVPRLRKNGRALRGGLLVGLALILVAEGTGYRNFSGYMLEGLAGTAVIAASFWLVGAFVVEACAALDGGDAAWAVPIRTRLGLSTTEGFPGLVWLRLLLTIGLWVGAALLLLRAWGLSDTGTAMLLSYLVDGFAVGDVQFVPAKVLTGIVVFALLFALAKGLRRWVETKWLWRSRMDRGAKDALVTITGYLGFVAAALLGFAAAGISLSSLAMIASALSVGIGFGLQHVVSNFVAGLILLFERPIKTGDWVVVGGTEGIVKRIRVRATEIRTFERSDVSVPNSELINGAVKNWTLRDRVGRASIPIGVAYGSDTELVRKLLLEAARSHPGVLHDVRGEPVKVQFKRFGDCALEFELSFTVRNVDERGDVISDLNFAIDKAFRAHLVEIPYPQHEVRIRGLEEGILGAALAARRAAGAADEEPERGAA
jgi:potassium-dependent mechanosensitive channel